MEIGRSSLRLVATDCGCGIFESWSSSAFVLYIDACILFVQGYAPPTWAVSYDQRSGLRKKKTPMEMNNQDTRSGMIGCR